MNAVLKAPWQRAARIEYPLLPLLITLLIFLAGGQHLLGDASPPWWLAISFVWLFGAILWASL
ncbi:MAG: calcium:proton antiporter, partial [Gammaproteobacteria bacterium]